VAYHAPGRTDGARRPHRRAPPQPSPTLASRRSGAPRSSAHVAVTLTNAWVRPETVGGRHDAARRVDGLQNRVFPCPDAGRALPTTDPPTSRPHRLWSTDWGFCVPRPRGDQRARSTVWEPNYSSPAAVRHWTRERPKENADGHGYRRGSRGWAAERRRVRAQARPLQPNGAGPSTRAGSPHCFCARRWSVPAWRCSSPITALRPRRGGPRRAVR